MINLAGQTPLGVRFAAHGLRLEWQIDGRRVETDFERFRPNNLVRAPGKRALRPVWRDFGDLPMSDLFFRATREKAQGLPFASGSFQTDWDVVDHIAAQPDNLPFAGAVFHMARTGSTLVHRLFSKTGIVLSLSEVPTIDRALFLTESWPAPERNRVLRGVVGTFARARRPSERHLMFKMTDAMPNTRLDLFREAFAHVPWIFIYRDPIEVIVSMLRGPTGNLQKWYENRAQTARRLGMPAVADGAMWPEGFIARTLARFCANAVKAAKATPPGLFLAVPYSRLPDAVWETIAPHFGVALSPRDREVMQAEARYSAKQPGQVEFQSDSAAKHGEADAKPRVRALAERLVMPLIEELKALPQG